MFISCATWSATWVSLRSSFLFGIELVLDELGSVEYEVYA